MEFIFRHGDIDSRRRVAPEAAMLEGARIHRLLQKKGGPGYFSEVSLCHVISFDNYDLYIDGRADGIIKTEDSITVDEIKGVYRDLKYIEEPEEVHLAQAKCYAYIYSLQNNIDEITVRITYCNLDTEEVRYFHTGFLFSEINSWFEALIQEYKKWADFTYEWREKRNASIRALKFPFPFREGQKELSEGVYRTIYHGKRLFLEAPTGVGKTLAVLFPAIKTMERGLTNRLFYLTAKNVTLSVAEEALQILASRGLSLKSVTLISKDKLCFLPERECNPIACPYAHGHFDRVNEALYTFLTAEDNCDRGRLLEFAEKMQVCPFEFALDLTLFSDIILMDYNYAFDPRARLQRFFSDPGKGNHVFLIDEAHNLVERARESFSSELCREDFLTIKKRVKEAFPSLARALGRCSKELLTVKKLSDADSEGLSMASKGQNRYKGTQNRSVNTDITKLLKELKKASAEFSDMLEAVYKRQKEPKDTLFPLNSALPINDKAESGALQGIEASVPSKKSSMNSYGALEPDSETMDLFFAIRDFLNTAEYLPRENVTAAESGASSLVLEVKAQAEEGEKTSDSRTENYVNYTELREDGRFYIKLFCINPAKRLREVLDKGRSAIFFSATLLPVRYYMDLLSGDRTDYTIYARSPFDPENRGIFIASDVSTLYKRRNNLEYSRIAGYLYRVVKEKTGNYIAFFPSHAFLREVYLHFQEKNELGEIDCVLQGTFMNEDKRDDFLRHFQEEALSPEWGEILDRIHSEVEIESAKSLLGFCVLGGIFGEGIDLKRDALIGAFIVGTGLPQVCFEREILMDSFSKAGFDGFDYAYRYPGMNKVLQASGRVIRTEEDRGIVFLLDDRFLRSEYKGLFPREWGRFQVVNSKNAGELAAEFWKADT